MDDIPLIHGLIPRIERQQSHYEFLWAAKPSTAMVDLIHASRIAALDDVFFPDNTKTVLTTTIADDQLSSYRFQDEIRIISEFEPDYVIPFDLPVYENMTPSERQENIETIATRTRDLHTLLSLPDNPSAGPVQTSSEILEMPAETLAELPDTTVLPLVKGFNPLERQTLLKTASDINTPCIVKYGVQYMTVGGDTHYSQLTSELAKIAEESNNYPTLIIGLTSPSGMFSLEGVPSNVIAAAGTNQWVSHVDPTNNSPQKMRDKYYALAKDIADTLNTPEPPTPQNTLHPPKELSTFRGKRIDDSLTPTNAGAAGDPEYGFDQRKRPSDAATALEAGLAGALKNTGDKPD